MRGDIYFAELSNTVGSEQGGYRPVIVIQNNVGNKYSPTTLVAPLTTKIKKNSLPTHVTLEAANYDIYETSVVLLEQVRVIDKNRLKKYVTTLNGDKLNEINVAIAVSFGLNAGTAA